MHFTVLRPHPSRCGRPVLAGLLLTCTLLAPLRAEPVVQSDEYRLKAAFIFNFSQFIDWPPSAFAAEEAPLRLCLLGRDPFGESLKALEKRRSKGRAIAVQHVRSLAEARNCHVLYIDDPQEALGNAELARGLGNAPVLTISSAPDATSKGIGIGFVSQSDKLRWSLNLDALKRAQLRVSAKLIEVAISVTGEARN